MTSLPVFVRKAKLSQLQRYFARNNIVLKVDWSAPTTTPVLAALRELDQETHARVVNDFSRVAALSDEAGQTALHAVVVRSSDLDGLLNGHARAFSVFLESGDAFRRAEEIRYTDDHRRGRQWDGFKGTPGLEIKRDEDSAEAFKAAVRDRFGSEKVHVDLFDRRRRQHAKDDVDLIQATCPVSMVLNFGALIASGATRDVLTDPKVRAVYLGEEVA